MREMIKKLKIAVIVLAILVAVGALTLVWVTYFGTGGSEIGSASSQHNVIAAQGSVD